MLWRDPRAATVRRRRTSTRSKPRSTIGCPAALRRTVGVPHAPDVQPLPLAKPRCCATCGGSPTRTSRSTASMIPLGSCTMKLNATAEMIPVTWPEFGAHPPVRAGRADARATRADRRARADAVRDHRLRRGVAAAERRLAGRVRRAAGDPRLSREPRRGASRRLPDPGIARTAPTRRRRRWPGMQVVVVGLRRRRQRRSRRPAGEGGERTRTSSRRS